MDSNRTKVTVKRIEKIPSKYYVQGPKVMTGTCTKVKIELSDSLWAEHKRLSDALSFKPALIKDYSKSFVAKVKETVLSAGVKTRELFSGALCFLIENAKHLAFSGGVSAAIAATACFVLMSTCSIGYEITVGDRVLGTVKSKATYEALITDINREIGYVSQAGFSPETEPDISLKIIPKGAFTADGDVKEMLKSVDADMLPAYGVYVDGEIIFAMANEQAALSVLRDYKDSFLDGKEDATAEFCGTVSVSRRFVPKAALRTKESAEAVLNNGRMEMLSLSGGEKLSDIAASYGITVDDLLQNNMIANPDCLPAGNLKVPTKKPLLSVKTVERKTISEKVPFQTYETQDPTKYEGNIYVEQEGAEGARVLDAYVTEINGVETERNIISENVLSAPVDKIVKIGTKEPPSPVGTGDLSVPASGTLSSRFGSRWGRSHQGIDLAASVGTNIYAADNGRVIYSEYHNGGFGYMIQIDHGNGIVTYYAHCSELLVPEGTVVAKGDLIARVGNTGRSTGPHLHFEVRENGTPVDPSRYLSELN